MFNENIFEIKKDIDEDEEFSHNEHKVDDYISFLEMRNILYAVNSKNFSYYENFGETDQLRDKNWKEEAYPALRWYSARGKDEVDFIKAKKEGRKKGDGKGKWPSVVKDDEYSETQLDLINEVVNLGFWELLGTHPKLIFLLMCVVGFGPIKPPNSNIWLGMPKTRKGKNKFHTFLLTHVNKSLNSQELEIYHKLYGSKSKMKELLQQYGLQDKEIKDILNDFEFKNEN